MRIIPRPVSLLWFTALALQLAVVTGCSGQTVRHLPNSPWLEAKTGYIDMKLWEFRYSVSDVDGVLHITGYALPKLAHYPQWATWYEQLVITAYLSDEHGTVLGKSAHTYMPRPIKDTQAFPLGFTLDAHSSRQIPYLSFGYRMLLTEHVPGKEPNATRGRRSFVQEDALDP